jgi:hypothetical protein
MDRGFVTEPERMGQPIRIFASRTTNGLGQSRSQEILAGNRLDGHKLILMR